MKKAISYLKQGKIIAYPTEAVYGIGCDPFNEAAVNKIKRLKSRKPNQGFILIASDWSQISNLCDNIAEDKMLEVKKSWPGPNTWVFPASQNAPSWICSNNTIALRVTDHPLAKKLCEEFGSPIVSTSANPSSLTPAKTAEEVNNYFNDEIDYIVEGEVGSLQKPTQIKNVLTGEFYRI